MVRRKRKSKNHDERLKRELENVTLVKKIDIDTNGFASETKKLEKIFEKSQKLRFSNKDKGKLSKKEKEALESGKKTYESTRGLSDGGKNTYFKSFQRIRKEINYKFGIVDLEKIEYRHIKSIIRDRIEAGQSPSTIHKTVHAINFVQESGVKTGILKESKMTDHRDLLGYLKHEGISRKSVKSHRYKANPEECWKVINELATYKSGKYKEYADVARLQLLSGGRRIELVGLERNEIHLDKEIVEFLDAKGGLDNKVWCKWSSKDKEFVSGLLDKSKDNKLFRFKDKSGNYISEEKVAERLNKLIGEAAARVGVGADEKNFTSHSLRGGFAYGRVMEYSKYKSIPGGIDGLIKSKIEEQPRLKSKYAAFKAHIKNKSKKENRANRQIQDFEKIQWLVSVDLNHSRQDIVRYYVPTSFIKEEISKYKK